MDNSGLVHETSKPSKLILDEVKVFNGTGWSPGPVYIIGDRIVDKIDHHENEDKPTTIKCQNSFLIPGLIDSHVHVSSFPGTTDGSIKNLETLRHWGITTCFDMECQPPELLKSLRKLPGLPDLFSAGYAAQYQRNGQWPSASSVPDSLAAKKFVFDRVAQSDDYIKMIADPPHGDPQHPEKPQLRGLDLLSMRTLADTARGYGLLSIAHAMMPEGIVNALAAGVDIVTHAPLAHALDGGKQARGVIAQMAKDKTICVPTLIMMKGTAKNPKNPKDYESTSKKAVFELHKAGVPLLAGTDANSVPEDIVPYSPPFGESLHDELQLLVEAGLTPLEALKSATELPAKYFRRPDRGSIDPGNRADLVLLREDPLKDIRKTRSIRKVWIAGQEFDVTHNAA